ncbi:MAG: ABC transporter permease [Bacteroidales bacterium]|nr:ABC transporter permease [Bacteroidales bacterium]
MHFLKTVFRNFKHNSLYTIINIIGLAIGLACFTFISLYIREELSYDKHNSKYQRIYRIESDITISDKNQQVAKSSFALAPAMKREFPEIVDFVRFRSADNGFLRYNDKQFYEDNLYFADSSVFNLFDLKIIYGSSKHALSEPNSVILNESLAEKYFGDLNPVGKVIVLNNKIDCKVTAVFENLPANTHLKFDGLVSFATYSQIIGDQMFRDLSNIHFWAIRLFSYVLLSENSTIEDVHRNFKPLHDKYIEPVSKRLNGKFELLTTRLDKIHLYSNLDWDLPAGNITTIVIFTIIAFFILIIASINYMNLATARSAHKAKEVGVRKVLGADKTMLRLSLLGESVLVALIAFILAIVLVELLLPSFNNLTDKSLTFYLPKDIGMYLLLLFITILVGLLSGSYPALYLSSFRPVVVLKGVVKTGRQSGMFRKMLIIFQFTIAIVMITGTIVVTRQLNFIQNRDLGFEKENVIILRSTDTTFKKKIPAFKDELLQHPNIYNIATSNTVPGGGGYLDVFLVEGIDKMEEQLMNLIYVDHNFIDLMGMKVIKGRNFSKNFGTDKEKAVIINLEAARKLGWDEDALGKEIHRRDTKGTKIYKVIGVVQNFNFNSLYDQIGPLVIFLEDGPQDLMSIRLNPKNSKKTISEIEQKWSAINPGEPFKYDYLENQLNGLYDTDNRVQKIFGAFAFISIFISLMGLFGLSSFVTEQYSKNAGIRKLLGASVKSLIYMFSKDFMKLVFIAFIIAVPVSWYFLENWLSHFAYHTSIHPSIFLLAGFMVMLLAQLTVIVQTMKTAFTNPVDVIMYE